MTMRSLLAAAATVFAASASGAFAADMPEGPPPQVIYAPDDAAPVCGSSFGRHVDHVWRPPQVAYIVAGSCGHEVLSGLKNWLNRAGVLNRENVLVYYNGGSVYRTDIRSINVPYQAQLHR